MSLTERLAIIIDANSGGAVREFDRTAAAAGRLSKTADQQRVTIGRLSLTHEQLAHGLKAGIATAAVSAAYALGRFGKAAVAEARDAARVGRLTEAVITSTGQAANVTADEVADLAQALSNKAGIDDEVIQSGENVLLTFTKVRNEVGEGNDVFDQATTLALELSVALGRDLNSSIIQVGKALNDPIKGITAMTRAGVSFTEQQKEQITTLVESGKTLEAQKLILGELGTEFAGAAEAGADPAQKLTVAWQTFEEEVGTALLPAIDGITHGLTEVAGAAQFIAGNSTLRRLTLLFLGSATALYTVNKALKTYKAIQGAELIQILSKAALGHTAVATATAAEGTAAVATTAAVETLVAAETTAAATTTGLLAKLGAVAKLGFTGLAGIGVGIGGLKTGSQEAAGAVDQFIAAAIKAGASAKGLYDEIHALGGEMSLEGKWTGISADELDNLYRKYGVAKPAAEGLAGAEGDLAGAHEDAAKAAQEAREQEQKLLDARIASFNSDIAYKRSELEVADALDAVREAADSGSQEDYRKAVLDAKDALLSEADAAVQLAQDHREAAGKTLSAEAASRIYRGELSRLASGLAPGSPLRRYLKGLIDDLNDAGRDRHSTLTITTVQPHTGQVIPRGAATGGPVYGPGTGTSDSVPMMLSNGEYVVKADGSNLIDALRYYAPKLSKTGTVQTTSSGSSTTYNVQITNPTPEPASVSVPRALREASYVAGVAW
jgi:hypothetical protein